METRHIALAAFSFVALGAAPALAQDDAAPNEMQSRACDVPFGKGDEIGAAQRLTPQMAKDAAALVTEGKSYPLGIELNSGTPAYGTRTFRITVLPGQTGGATLGPTKMVSNDDVIMGFAGIGSQLDGLGHIGIDNMYYGCHPGSEIVDAAGLKQLGVENVPNIVTRGVVLDMTADGGAALEPGTAFNREEIQAQAEEQGIEIREGDVVLFHTGWLDEAGSERDRFLKGQPGLGVDGADWLAEQGVVAIGADNWGLEVVPFEEGTGVFEVHQTLLAENGIYILENMNTGPLVQDGVSEFMFVLGHPKVTGAVQATINPTAIR